MAFSFLSTILNADVKGKNTEVGWAWGKQSLGGQTPDVVVRTNY